MSESAANESFQQIVFDNSVAVDELIAVADQLSEAAWNAPMRSGAWTPGQHVAHVTLSYCSAVAELRNGTRAQLRGTHARRLFWRAVGLTQVLYLRRLPGGAESPVEFVPPADSPPRTEAIGALGGAVTEWMSAMSLGFERRPYYKLQHPYFELISLRSTAILCAVHTRHHAKLLRQFASAASDSQR